MSHIRVYDQSNAEYVDPYDGIVEQEYIFESRPTIRASDYAEWNSKRQSEVFISQKDRRLWTTIWSVGEKLNAPKWLREEVFWFYKKARVLKTQPMFKGKGLHLNEKCIRVVYYVVAKKRGEYGFAEKIASEPCDTSGNPCYINRKKGDPEFKRYLRVALRYASVIYPNHKRDPITLFDKIVRRNTLIPEMVYKRAKEIMVKIQGLQSGRNPTTVMATCIKLALDELMPHNSKPIFNYVCTLLKVSELSVKNYIRYLKKIGAIKG